MKDKSKPDYTKFMKKPAPLEAPPQLETAPKSPPADAVSDQPIPWAEIVSIDEQHSHKKDQTVYFEIVADTPDALESGTEAVGLKPDTPPAAIGQAHGSRVPRADQQVLPPAARTLKSASVASAQTLEHYWKSYEPPPLPLLLSPILLAMLALWLQ